MFKSDIHIFGTFFYFKKWHVNVQKKSVDLNIKNFLWDFVPKKCLKIGVRYFSGSNFQKMLHKIKKVDFHI